MTLGRCPLIIFCSRGTPPSECPLSQPTLSLSSGLGFKVLVPGFRVSGLTARPGPKAPPPGRRPAPRSRGRGSQPCHNAVRPRTPPHRKRSPPPGLPPRHARFRQTPPEREAYQSVNFARLHRGQVRAHAGPGLAPSKRESLLNL